MKLYRTGPSNNPLRECDFTVRQVSTCRSGIIRDGNVPYPQNGRYPSNSSLKQSWTTRYSKYFSVECRHNISFPLYASNRVSFSIYLTNFVLRKKNFIYPGEDLARWRCWCPTVRCANTWAASHTRQSPGLHLGPLNQRICTIYRRQSKIPSVLCVNI